MTQAYTHDTRNERAHESKVQEGSDERDGIERSQVRHREERRVVKAEDRAKASCPEGDGEDAAQPP